MTELFLIRHGQTQANTMGLKQGTINDERTYLTEQGKQQAATLAALFHPANLTAMYLSPLHRARQTAQIINHKLGLPTKVDRRLLEISYGKWDGQLNAKLQKEYPQLFYPLINDVRPNYYQVAGGERFADVTNRVASFTKDIVNQYPQGRIVVISHGFTIRSFAAMVTGTHGLEILEPANCSVSKIVVEPTTMTMHLLYYSRVATNQF